MSLINRMLQDLDRRSAEGSAMHVSHGPVRAVPVVRRTVAWWWILAGVLTLASCFVTWQWHDKKILQEKNTLPDSEILSSTLKMSSVLHMADSLSWNEPAKLGKTMNNVASNPESNSSSNLELEHISRSEASGTKLIRDIKLSELSPVTGPATDATAGHRPVLANADTAATVVKLDRETTPQQRAENAYRKALVLQQQDKSVESAAELEHALQFDPRHSAARQMLIGFLLEGKRQDDAMRKLQEGVTLDPSQSSMAMMLARLQVEHNEVLAAIDTLQRSLSYASDRADYQAFLAALFQRQSWHKDAIELYTAALRKAPQNGVWWMGMGISLQAENRLPQAQDAFNHAKASNTLSEPLKAFVEQRLTQLAH